MDTAADDQVEKRPIQCFVVGDSEVGKTFCLQTFTKQKPPSQYTSKSFSDLKMIVEAEGRSFNVLLCDSSGRSDYAQFRKLVYPNTDVVILCFALNSPESMNNVRSYWYPEIQRECPYRPVILVGTKCDLRMSVCDAARIVSARNGEDLAKEIGARGYLECSSLTQQNIDVVFQKAALAGADFAHEKKNLKRSSCRVT